MEIKIIKKESEKDINIKNEPFEIIGIMIPSLDNSIWTYRFESLESEGNMCFPDENYNFDEMSKHCTFIGAYENEECIGLAVMQEHFLKYMYLYDLKVNKSKRNKGIGSKLIEKALSLAKEKGYIGIYTVAQDNNHLACKFYLKNGFCIGGFDSKCYEGTSQKGKSDIFFYKNA